MLNFEASKPRVKGGPVPWGPPGSAPGHMEGLVVISDNPNIKVNISLFYGQSQLFQSPDIRKNSHFGGENDRGYESGFTTRCLLHNFSTVRNAI